MNIITLKVRLVDAPVPPFVGTRITIRTTDSEKAFGITTGKLADGHASVRIDWGDGEVETIPSINYTEHQYESPGEHVISISDDISTLGVASSDSESPFGKDYPKRIQSVFSNAKVLQQTRPYCFANCINMTSVDLADSAIETHYTQSFAFCESMTTYRLPKGLLKITSSTFSACTSITSVNLPNGINSLPILTFEGCVSLSGNIRLPFITDIKGSATGEPFQGCPNIAAFHFAAANEAAIRASSGYIADPTLGTGSATCIFDL